MNKVIAKKKSPKKEKTGVKNDMILLFSIYAVYSASVRFSTVEGSCFNFHKNKTIFILSNNIDFTVVICEICFNDFIFLLF